MNLSDPFARLTERWFWPVIAGIIGGILGMVFSLFFPPRYEAAAAFTVGVNYGTLDFNELVIEDRLLDRVWQLVRSDETLQGAIELLEAEQGEKVAWESLDTFKAHTRVDSRLSRWELIGIDRDPGTAAAISNAWYQIAMKRLDEAYEHAWNAISLPGAHFDLGCVTLHPELDVPDFWECIVVAPGLSPDVAGQLKAEIEASHGILPVVSYERIASANAPQQPVLWSRGILIFAGSTLGLLLGVVLATKSPSRKEPIGTGAESMAEDG